MGYSSDLTDKEWEITLAVAVIPEEENSTSSVDKATTPQWHILSAQKWLQLEGLTKRSTTIFNAGRVTRPVVFWHYQNWCEDSSLERIETQLHGKVREQVKKNRSGQP